MIDATPKRMSRERRRESLIEAAATVLGRRDATSFTFDDIAAEAGVSATLPYKYFDSADEIASQLYDRVVGGIDRSIDALLDSDTPFDDAFVSSFLLWCDAAREHGLLLLALMDGRTLPHLRPRIDRRRSRSVRLWADAIRDEFGLGQDDARLASASIVAATSAMLNRWLRDRRDEEETARKFLRMARAQCEALASGQGR